MLFLKIKHKLYTLQAKWVYRKIAYNDICCCGESFGLTPNWSRANHDIKFSSETRCNDISCPSRCQKEYAIESYVERRMKL
ncbi:hypothetical protein NVP1121O_242 [Vibrio phage 1.121.O._10N.286.46.C4]|nr:hypothetical protein NVP1121O_242 [Vibrio phage 1.121.O._10N.286.46.C4]